MSQSSVSSQLTEELERTLPTYLKDLRAMTSVDCGTHQKPGLDVVASLAASRLREAGAEVEIVQNPEDGNDVVARLRGTGRGRVFILTHSDTAYPPGTADSRPFRIENGRAYAPGVADMKSGLLSGIYAMQTLRAINYHGFESITLLCDSDEEGAPRHSVPLIESLAREADAVLVMEPGRANGNIVSARRGSSWFSVTARGRESHSGVSMDAGRNAIVALSEKVLELWKLNGTVPGLGLSPGMINGGVAVNTVPGEATCDFDLRHLLPEDRLNFEAKVREILTHSMIDDVTFAVGSFHEMPPMPKTEAIERLVGMAKQASEELGFQVEDTLTGGCSDGCIAAATGVPVLDALGPVGGAAHSDGEYTEVDTIVPRTAMLGRIVTLICEK